MNASHNIEEVRKLFDNTKACSKPGAGEDELMNWVTEIQKADEADLVALTSRLSSGEEKESRNLKALRAPIKWVDQLKGSEPFTASKLDCLD